MLKVWKQVIFSGTDGHMSNFWDQLNAVKTRLRHLASLEMEWALFLGVNCRWQITM